MLRLIFLVGVTSGVLSLTAASQSGPYGGVGGSDMGSDGFFATSAGGGNVTEVRVRYGKWIDSIQFKYGQTLGKHYGGNGGRLTTVDLSDDEIVGFNGCINKKTYIGQLEIVTKNTTYSFGSLWGCVSRFSAKPCGDERFGFFKARSGRALDQISFIWIRYRY